MSPRAGLTKQAVLDAAIELADETSLEDLTLAALANKLGIRTPSLYNHIDGLPGLRHELAMRGVHELSQRLMRAAVGKSGKDAMIAVAEAQRKFILENPGLYAATIKSPAQMDLFDPEYEAASQETVRIVIDTLPGDLFDESEGIHAVRVLRSYVHGFTTLELAGGFGLPVQTDKSFHYGLNLIISGFLQRADNSAESVDIDGK